MTELTLKEAAEATGKNKVTLLKSIQKGKISAVKNELGEWRIDPSELFRVYEPSVLPKTEKLAMDSSAVSGREMEFLMEKIALLERERANMASVIDDLRGERDAWRKSAETWQIQACALLEDGRKQEDTQKENTSWFKKLFG